VTPLRLVVGLGNPGREYTDTRHNAGYWWVERVVAARGGQWRAQAKFAASVCRFQGEHDLWFLKPVTYMNASGRAVGAFARFHDIEPGAVLVVHDELDLPPGTVRIKLGGGHAGHNGLKDVVAHFGSNAFWRLRIGIGHPGDRNAVTDYVLHAPSREESSAIEQSLERSVGCFDAIARGDMTAAMRVLHEKPRGDSMDSSS
jgi:PTH1 family peptidyl-tRNA hydrolase